MTFNIEIREKNGVRFLHFESNSAQGAMHISDPWQLELEYTRVMMACLLMRPAPAKVLLIGLGAGSLVKFLYRHYPQAQLTVVEIAPRVVEAAQRYFALPHDPARLNIVIADGVEFIKSSEEQFDLILVDGFNEHSHPGDLNTLPFYRNCRSRLRPQGLMVVNLIGLCRGVKGGFAYIETAFDNRAVLFPPCISGNSIAFATVGEAVQCYLSEMTSAASMLKERTGLDILQTVASLEGSEICPDGVLRF